MKRALFLTVSLLVICFSLFTTIRVLLLDRQQDSPLPVAAAPAAKPPGHPQLSAKDSAPADEPPGNPQFSVKRSFPAAEPPAASTPAAPGQPEPRPAPAADPGYGIPSLHKERSGGFYNEEPGLQKVPVLCYHRIDTKGKDHYHNTREEFLWQMQYLARHHNVISTAELVDHIRWKQGISAKRVDLPPRAVVIQVDDNYRSVYSDMFPLLHRLGLKWSFFVYRHHHKPNPEAHLRVMARTGVDFQSHTMTHPWFHKPARGRDLKDMVRDLHWQIGGSKKYLEQLSGRPVLYLAYPFGTYSDLAIAICRKFGYHAMFAADGGYATEKSPLYAVERILVTRGWSKSYFRQVVEGRVRYRRQFKPALLLNKTPEKRTLSLRASL